MKLFMVLVAAVLVYSGLNLNGLVQLYQATNDFALIGGVIKHLLATTGSAGVLVALAIRNW